MKILVTGGAGFIASHIVDAYIADGHDVVVIDNLSTGRRENLNPGAKFYEIDICDPDVAEIFEKERPDALNHHAAQIDVRKSVADPLFDLRVNLGGLINLVEAGRKNGLKKVILASSGGTVYGDQKVYPATEEHSLHPISPYGLNKLASEQYLFYCEKAHGIKWTALRYANVYGPRQSPHGEAGVVAIFINKMLSGGEPIINGDGKQTRDYVYVGDVVEANRLALRSFPSLLRGEGQPARRRFSGGGEGDHGEGNHGEGGRAYNIGTGIETDVNTIFRTIRELCGSRVEESHGPAKPGETARSSISSQKISKELGWSPKTVLPEGLGETLKWFEGQR